VGLITTYAFVVMHTAQGKPDYIDALELAMLAISQHFRITSAPSCSRQ